jgi:hypothetical protein
MTGERTAEPMSELGHSRRIDRAPFTFGLPRLADILRVGRHVLQGARSRPSDIERREGYS